MIKVEIGVTNGGIERIRRMGVMRRKVLLRGVRAKRALAFICTSHRFHSSYHSHQLI